MVTTAGPVSVGQMQGAHPRVLSLLRVYLPGYRHGGPIRTLANMVEQLSGDYEWYIVTTDRDVGDAAPYSGVSHGQWHQVGAGHVYYARPGINLVIDLLRILRSAPYDVLYLQSFFDPLFTALPLLARSLGLVPFRPTVLAPRGELSPGALGIKSLKKRLYLRAAFWLYRSITYQASSEFERDDIVAAVGLSNEIAVAPDLGADAPRLGFKPVRAREGARPLRVVFLSRIDRMKNLDFAIQVISKCTIPVVFDIYGPPSDGEYVAECVRLIETLPSNVSAQRLGEVKPSKVVETISDYDVFFLPTKGENFGHAILEALIAGTPVLISDRTPWRRLRELQAGYDLPLCQPDAFVRVLEALHAQTEDERQVARAAAHRFGASWAHNEGSIEKNRELFQRMITVK